MRVDSTDRYGESARAILDAIGSDQWQRAGAARINTILKEESGVVGSILVEPPAPLRLQL